MKLFLHYLRSKALKIGAFLLFALLFLVSFRLYHLPLAAVWYPSALCAALGLVILLLDFRRVRQRHLELQQILKASPPCRRRFRHSSPTGCGSFRGIRRCATCITPRTPKTCRTHASD